MSHPDYQHAIAYSLNRLENELSPDLVYHSYWHTRYDVMAAAERLARMNKIPDEDRQLLEVAAAFHDIGYLFTQDNHEQVGIQIASEVLPGNGFTQAQIDQVSNLILATRLPQTPQNLLEAILADADLDVLGREDFFERSELLRQENAFLGREIPRLEWAASQLAFLQEHRYFTKTARQLRQKYKQQIMAELQSRLLKV